MVIHFQSGIHELSSLSLLFKLLNFISLTAFVSFSLLTMTSVPFSAFQILKHELMANIAAVLLATNLVLCSLMFYIMWLLQYILLASKYLTVFSFHVKYLGLHVKILHRMKQNSYYENDPYETKITYSDDQCFKFVVKFCIVMTTCFEQQLTVLHGCYN